LSRGGRDDERSDVVDRAPEWRAEARTLTQSEDITARGLSLPRGEEREPVEFRGRTYSLNGAETRILATVGAFRVLPPDDVATGQNGQHGSRNECRHLAEQGLLARETITDRHGSQHVVSLTREGKGLLDAHATTRPDGQRQTYYAGVLKPRELAHDAQLYRVFKSELAQIEREGGRVSRIVLDYELKREYQTFLNREDRPSDATSDRDRIAFAAAHDLTVVHGHLELPDLRIEYETEDGRLEHRDVELITEHYSRGQLVGKARAGFTCYRAAGAGRGRGGNARPGGSPFDPRNLERL
jgi:hypothetical protein